MGLIDRLKDYWNNQSDDDMDDEDFYDSYDEDEEEEYEERRYNRYERPVDRSRRDDKVVSIHTTAKLQVVIVKPTQYEEVAEITDHLLEKRTVVLNLEQASKDISRRVVDFLSGAAYALNGQLKRIANNTYIITPLNVGLVGADVIGELENNGVFF